MSRGLLWGGELHSGITAWNYTLAIEFWGIKFRSQILEEGEMKMLKGEHWKNSLESEFWNQNLEFSKN